jgi:uncharacterized RDD family membrane protein YckC
MSTGKERPATASKGQPTAGPRWTQTWLSGARTAGAELGYPGERLGLPEKGSGAVAGYGRRLLALFIDWALSLLVASLLARTFDLAPPQRSLLTLLVFGVMVWILVGLLGTTIGKRLCGIRVVRPDGRPVGLALGFARAFLIVLVVPAMIWDRDYRGLHDKAANTIVVSV